MRANTARIATAAVYAPLAYHEAVEEKLHAAAEVARNIVLPFVKNVALFVAAPFVGLAYALAFPFVGIALLGWVAVRAAVKRAAA